MSFIESLIVLGVTSGIVAGVFGFAILMNHLLQNNEQPFSREVEHE